MTTPKGYITRQAKRLSSGEINRRRFVMQALSAGVTMPTAMSLASRAEAARPRRGGLLRHAVTAFDPTTSALITGNTLTEMSDNGSIRGELAEEFETAKNNTLWTFRLRDGVTFHSGSPLKAADVTATINSFTAHFPRDPLSENIADIKAGKGRVTFTLRRPDPEFANRLADPRLVVRPLADGRLDYGDGTGAYIHADRRPGLVSYVRNPEHWKPDVGHFDAVEVTILRDPKTRQNAILNGDVDVVDGLDPRSVALVGSMPKLGIVERNGSKMLGFACSERLAGNPQLRLALDLVMPRQAMVEKVLLGHGHPSGRPQDLNAATDAVRRAGKFGPLRIVGSDTNFPGAANAARLVAAEAGKIGLSVHVAAQSEEADLVACVMVDESKAIGAMVANTISAHVDRLAHADVLRHVPERLAERAWFSDYSAASKT